MNRSAIGILIVAALVGGAAAWRLHKSATPLAQKSKTRCAYPVATRSVHAKPFVYDAAEVDACESNPTGVDGWTGLDLTVAKLSAPDALFAGGTACGSCFRVEGENATLTARLLEHCKGCDGIALDPVSYKTLSGKTDGQITVKLTAVACPVSEGVRFTMVNGTDPYLFKINVTNNRHPVRELEVDTGNGFVRMNRSATGTFVFDFGRAQSALAQARATDIWGQVVTAKIPTNAGDSTLTTSQFGDCR